MAAPVLLPHHRRNALFLVAPTVDLLDVAVAIARDDAARIDGLLAEGALRRPSLAELAEACVSATARFQVLIVQPYVLAQLLPAARETRSLGEE